MKGGRFEIRTLDISPERSDLESSTFHEPGFRQAAGRPPATIRGDPRPVNQDRLAGLPITGGKPGSCSNEERAADAFQRRRKP